MRDAVSELRRISLPRTPVNKGEKEGRIDWFEEGRFVGRGRYKKWRENRPLSHRKKSLCKLFMCAPSGRHVREVGVL
jgi:hypothetical protein